jgi:hypothetical protein
MASIGCGAKPQWQEVSSDEGGFTVQMPGTPRAETRTQGALTINGLGVKVKDSVYRASYANLPPGSGFDYSAGIKAIAANYEGAVTSESDFTIEGCTGKSYEIEITKPMKGFASGRMVVVKDRLYQLLVMGSTIRAADPDVQTFFNSLTLKPGS